MSLGVVAEFNKNSFEGKIKEVQGLLFCSRFSVGWNGLGGVSRLLATRDRLEAVSKS
jgi:hypothetical protein